MRAHQILEKHGRRTKTQSLDGADVPIQLRDHLHELRQRLIRIIISIILFSGLAYFVQQYIVNFLLRPSQGAQFIYTSPGGGINFLFTVCMYVGIAASTPVIIYQLLGFFAPLIKDETRSSIISYSCFASLLAVVGVCFGYFVGLPAALHFLSHQFATKQIHPLFTIQEYMSFLMIYLLGSAALFQLPIILLFINRIRPLPPRKLFKAERYVIVLAFVVAMIMAPTPNVFDQLIIAGPVVLVFNLSVVLVWLTNRLNRQPGHIVKLLEKDRQIQVARLEASGVLLEAEPLRTAQPHRKFVGNQLISSGTGVMDVKLAGRARSASLTTAR